MYHCQQNVTLRMPDIFDSDEVKLVDSSITWKIKLPHFHHECYRQLLNWLQIIEDIKFYKNSQKRKFEQGSLQNKISQKTVHEYFKNHPN